MPIQNSGKISVTDIVEEFSSRLPVDIANFNNITLIIDLILYICIILNNNGTCSPE